MRLASLSLTLTLLSLPALVAAQQPEPPQLVAPTGPRTPEEERKGFHLPEGFTIELVAAEPEINKPMNLAFDDKGRLWVTSTIEYPWPVTDGRKPRDKVVILDDFGPDGRARKVSTFVDGLNIPIGLLPIGDGKSALVHSIPAIRKYEDTDGDGKADKVTVAYEKFGFRDTHGMTNAFTWGFDGWIYACHGFNNDSEIKGSDNAPMALSSGNTYRMKADGSHVEPYTRGQVNPFGLNMDPLGNLYSSDCHSRPIYALLRGAYYPSFGKPHDGIGFGPEVMTHDHGSTGIAGIVYYTADQFPKAFHSNVFIGNVVTNKINRDTFAWSGSTPRAVEQPDFLTSDDPWFRPVDIKLGPDGALYVADFYNKIIGHYEVPLTHPGRDRERGRIWRISHKGKPLVSPDLTTLDIPSLVKLLGEPNLPLRLRAANQLVAKGGEAVIHAAHAAAIDPSATRRVHAAWILQRLGALDTGRIKEGARDGDEQVRVHAQRILAERPDLKDGLHELALNGLKDANPFVERAAAEALGRHPAVENLHPLLEANRAVPPADDHLKHVVRMALRDQLRPAPNWDALKGAGFSEADRRDIADVATGVPSKESAAFLLGHIAGVSEPADRQERYVRHIARYGDQAEAKLAAFVRKSNDPTHQATLIRAIQQGFQERGVGFTGDIPALALDLTRSFLKSGKNDQVLLALDLAGSLRQAEAAGAISDLIASPQAPNPQRNAAITALAAIRPADLVARLSAVVDRASDPIQIREHAANTLNGLNQPETRAALVKSLATAPGRLQSTIALGLARTHSGADALLAAIEAGKASARLLQERAVSVNLAARAVPDLDARVAKLLKGLPPADAKTQELLNKRRAAFLANAATASASRGALVFEKNCAICHQLGGKGAKVGPQLDGVGVRGAERLTEDILDSNRNVDQAFRSTNIALKDGRTVSGLVLRQEGQVVILADSQGKDVRVPVDTIEERLVSPLSPMPANLSDQIAESDFQDLIKFLLEKK